MSFENALDLEKETYDKHFKLGYDEGIKDASIKIEENGFIEGVQVNLNF